jgi:hypothetical protein
MKNICHKFVSKQHLYLKNHFGLDLANFFEVKNQNNEKQIDRGEKDEDFANLFIF